MKVRIFLIALVVGLFGGCLYSQQVPSEATWGFEAHLGMWNGAGTSKIKSNRGLETKGILENTILKLSCFYNLGKQVSVTASIGLIGIGDGGPEILDESFATPILVGIRYYVPPLSSDNVAYWFFSAAGGVYNGFGWYWTESDEWEERDENTFGGRFGVGVEFFLRKEVKIIIEAGYNVMSDFKKPVGLRKNVNGLDASIGLGIVF